MNKGDKIGKEWLTTTTRSRKFDRMKSRFLGPLPFLFPRCPRPLVSHDDDGWLLLTDLVSDKLSARPLLGLCYIASELAVGHPLLLVPLSCRSGLRLDHVPFGRLCVSTVLSNMF